MSGVKRYGSYGTYTDNNEGPYVLYSDYATVVAERDELARLLERTGYDVNGLCRLCRDTREGGHAPGCPVALAERITKEAGDGS